MKWWGTEPVIPGREFTGIKDEMKKAREIEIYRISERFLFIPGKRLSWRYIALEDIRGVISGVTKDSEDRVLVSYSVERPNLRIMYRDGFMILQFEHRRNAEAVSAMIKEGRNAQKL